MLPLARSINALSTSVRAKRTLESASGQYSHRLKRICLRSRGLGSSFEWVHLSIYSNRTSARPLRKRAFAAKLHVFARRKCDGADSVPRALRGVAVTIAVNGGIDGHLALPFGPVTDCFVPHASTGFQVKKQNMRGLKSPMRCARKSIRRSIRYLPISPAHTLL